MVTIRRERTIGAPAEQVFDWLADPANLTAAPLAVKAGWSQGSAGPAVGAVRDVLALGFWFREEITAYDPPRSYSYRITRSFPAFGHQGGTLTCIPVAGGTHVVWDTSYRHPLYGGGALAGAVSSRLLPRSFEAIIAGCAQALER